MGDGTPRRALVIGGGIAGPVAAMSLQRVGIEAVVFEGRGEPRDHVGAFLNLAPNGLHVLEHLGVRERVEDLGTPTTEIVFNNHRGKQLGRNPETTLLIKRGLLNRGLREAAVDHGIEIRWGKRLVDVKTASGSVTAVFADGTEERGDFLLGCDGIHSRTRQVVLPGAPVPQYTGVIDCGAFTHLASVPPSNGVMQMTFGLNGFFGYQVVPSGEIYWFENFHDANEPDRAKLEAIPHERWRANLLDMHRGDHYPIPDLIQSTEGGIGRWPIYDMPTMPTWHKGRVCLIGDAAHATSPHVGQGASMAMEDAIVLAKFLRDIPEPGRAFATFEARRRNRVDKIVEQARKTGNQKSPGNAVGRAIRDLVLPFFLKRGVKDTEWVYAWRFDWDEPATVSG